MKKANIKTPLMLLFVIVTICFTDIKLQAQNEAELIASHYVFPAFSIATVKMKDGNIGKAMMNYNMLTEEMIFENDGIMLAVDSLNSIDTIYLESRQFVPHNKMFYEVLVIAPVSLFMQHRCNLIQAGSPSGYGGTTETGAATSRSSLTNSGRAYKLTLPSEYHVTYATQLWIRKDDIFYKANTNRQIMKIFPEKSKDIKQIIKQNKLDLKNADDLILLVIRINEMLR